MNVVAPVSNPTYLILVIDLRPVLKLMNRI